MGYEFRSFFYTDARKLLWLMGLTFVVIITFQYVELPYSHVFSSLFSTRKIPASNSTFSAAYAPSSNSVSFGDTTLANGGNTAEQLPAPEGNKTDLISSFQSERNGSFRGNVQYNESFNAIGNSSTEISELPTKVYFPADISKNAAAPTAVEGNEQSSVVGWDSGDHQSNQNVSLVPGYEESSNVNFTSSSHAIPPTTSDASWLQTADKNATTPASSLAFNTSATPNSEGTENREQQEKHNSNNSLEKAPLPSVPNVQENPQVNYPGFTESGYLSIAEMSKLLQRSRISYGSNGRMRYSEADQELRQARIQIENSPTINDDPILYASVFRNISMFKRSYALMEKILKVYVYKEGKKPIMHVPVLKGIYASEGWFMKLLESNKNFVTVDPKRAHLFYLPFSSRILEETLYVKDSHSHTNLIEYLKNYLDLISGKYPFWNRTRGADHFLVACHDWAPTETKKIMANCIRALCNSDVKEGFVFGKDVALPETKMSSPSKALNGLGGKPPSQRPILAFFAGKTHHGYLRPVLLSYWGDNRDPDMKIFGRLPRSKGNKNYINFMRSSKYCICAKGFEVNSPRVVESIFYECVPVILSDNFVPPFFESLNWESFAVFILEKDIPDLKKILLSIPEWKYREMQKRVKKVQRHFLWHPKPEKYDIFHMILHSVWFNRVFRT